MLKTQVAAQTPCPGSQRGCLGGTGSRGMVTHNLEPPTAYTVEEGNREHRESFKASTLTKGQKMLKRKVSL